MSHIAREQTSSCYLATSAVMKVAISSSATFDTIYDMGSWPTDRAHGDKMLYKPKGRKEI